MKKIIALILMLSLTACINRTDSLLETLNKPLVNIDENVATKVDIEAKAQKLSIKNISDEIVKLKYKFFWFDKTGASQLNNMKWYKIILNPQQQKYILVKKLNKQSNMYRIYFRGNNE